MTQPEASSRSCDYDIFLFTNVGCFILKRQTLLTCSRGCYLQRGKRMKNSCHAHIYYNYNARLLPGVTKN